MHQQHRLNISVPIQCYCAQASRVAIALGSLIQPGFVDWTPQLRMPARLFSSCALSSAVSGLYSARVSCRPSNLLPGCLLTRVGGAPQDLRRAEHSALLQVGLVPRARAHIPQVDRHRGRAPVPGARLLTGPLHAHTW